MGASRQGHEGAGYEREAEARQVAQQAEDVETPLENEEDVHIESDDEEVKRLMIELPRAYRKVSPSDGGCPPMTTLDVRHHIGTGSIFHRSRLPIQLSKRKVPRILSRTRIYQDSPTPKIILRCRELDQWCLLN